MALLPQNCNLLSFNISNLSKNPFVEITIPEPGYNLSRYLISTPSVKCCLDNVCEKCCSSEQCSSNASLYPIILLHGHAFNKNLEADYSMDSFTAIQDSLEDIGYLNAGAISLYTKLESDKEQWHSLNKPVSLKVTYYLDYLKQENTYMLVQRKSEYIDVYALRLKEIIDRVKLKTGKDKVVVIAHSMGGLVARRYIQLFGEGAGFGQNLKRFIRMTQSDECIRFMAYYFSMMNPCQL